MRGTPKLFSQYFGVDPKALDKAGLLDPYVEFDTPLFIDPLLIDKSSNQKLSYDGLNEFSHHFTKVIGLLTISEKVGDKAWKGAEKLLSLEEPPENGLGYGSGARAGTSRSAEIRKQLLLSIKEVLRLGSKDPEMLSLMAFIEEGVGADTISDFTTRAMTNTLSEITHEFCIAHGIKVGKNSVGGIKLPIVKKSTGLEKPIILVPSDVLRHLPITEDWGSVWDAVAHNSQLRDKLNVMLGGIAKPTIVEQKKAVKLAVMQSSDVFDGFLTTLKQIVSNYDPNEDVLGFYKFRDLLLNGDSLVKKHRYDFNKSDEVLKVVMDTIESFQHHVEKGNLWEALWSGNSPKRERAAQLIYYAIADIHCRVNNVDVSGEPNMGGGPVDFKFSVGYNAKVLVELKRSMGTVVHGYKKQLEFYKEASKTDYAVFVVIDYGESAHKIDEIMKIRNEIVARGARASEIVVINASKKLSASKRN